MAVHGTGHSPVVWRGKLELVLSAPSKIVTKESYPTLQLDDAGQ